MYGGASSTPPRRIGSTMLASSPRRSLSLDAAMTSSAAHPTTFLLGRSSSSNFRKRRPSVTLQSSEKASSLFQQHEATIEEEEQLVDEYGDRHWRVTLFRFLHQQGMILCLAALLLFDIMLLVVDLVLEGTYPECSVISTRFGCVIVGPGINFKEVSCDQVCLDPPESIERTKYTLTIVSIGILLFFLAELFLHFVAVGARRFCTNIFLLFDFCIVLVSLWLEVVMTMRESKRQGEDVQAITVPLLIFSRSWRLLRLGHGALKEAHDYYGQRIDRLEAELADLRERLADTRRELGSTFSGT